MFGMLPDRLRMSEDIHVRRIFGGASQSVLLAISYSGDQIILNIMGRERRTYEGIKVALTVLVGEPEGKEPLERYLFRVTGKCIFKELRVTMTTRFTRLQAESNVCLL